MNQIINLHSIPELQKIHVRDDIQLRPLQTSDAERILQILATDVTIRNRVSVASRIYNHEDIATEIKHFSENSGLIRYTILKEDNPVGIVSLWRDTGFFGTPPQSDDYGFGYFLDPIERGNGIITNAIQTLMDIVIKNLYVKQFIAFCEDNNPQSKAVLARVGFEPTDETFVEPSKGWVERKYVKQVNNTVTTDLN